MGIASAVVGVFGVISAAGGMIGYVKAQSRVSLIVGVAAGALLGLCAIGLARGSSGAALGSAFIALLLGGRFAKTWRRTRRLMPDLIMLIMSVLTVASVTIALIASPR